jgi:hypothetical protein
LLRFVATQAIHKATYLFRLIRPYKKVAPLEEKTILFSQETKAEYLRSHIVGSQRFEHLIEAASKSYIDVRHQIASKAYDL